MPADRGAGDVLHVDKQPRAEAERSVVREGGDAGTKKSAKKNRDSWS